MLLDLSVFAQRDEGPNRGTTPRRGQGVENPSVCHTHHPRLPPPPPRRLGSTAGRPARHHRSDGTSTVWATTSPVASWTPTLPVCAKSAVWSSRVDGLSTRPHRRLSSRSNLPPSASVYRGTGSATPPPSSLGDATRSSNPASPIPHQVQKRLDKALRLAQRQPKQHPHRQHPFNRWIRIYKLSTPLRRPLIIPLLPQRIVQPDRQATTGDQRPIIRRPIFDPIHRFRLDRGRTARYFAHHRLSGKRGYVFLAGNHEPI